MAKSMLYHGYAPDWEQTFAKIEQTTINELQNIAKIAFSPQNRFILTYK
jgi:hypothetical protein